MESIYNTNDYKPKEEDLLILSEESGWLEYDKPIENKQVRMVIVEINGELYDLDNKIKTEDLISRILTEADLEDNIERLYKQINIKLNPKPQKGRESFYNTIRVKLN